MKHINLFVILSVLFFISCEKDDEIRIENLSGYVQKGPFINGTSITISELNPELIQTGRVFSSQIIDNSGNYEIRQIELGNQVIEIRASGFYFNEVRNESSVAPLTLYALSDIKDKRSLNVNVLSSLEKMRIEYLISRNMGFEEAKQQAQSEILRIFEISSSVSTESEMLDIMKEGEDNAILLAVSVILQGQLSVSELSELLANISTDIRTDGELNSETLGSKLINNARNTNTDQVRSNLESRYESLGMEVTVPEFEDHIDHFISNTDFVYTGNPKYPEMGFHGKNILNLTDTIYPCDIGETIGDDEYNSMKVKLKSLSSKVRVEITGKRVAVYEVQGWSTNVTPYVYDDYVFETDGSLSADLKIHFSGPGGATIKIYEDNNTTPTRIKRITLE